MKYLLGGGAVLRVVATLGVTPTVYVDSVEYRGVALFGGHRRPWTVPLLYALVGDSQLRVLAHAVIGAAAWVALAVAVAEAVRHPVVRLVAAGVVMAMSLAASITNYDSTITSESIAVSLAVLLLAAWLQMARHPSTRAAAVLLVVAVLFAFTRNDHPVVLAATVAPAVAMGVLGRKRAWAVLAIGLLVITGWSWSAAERNDEIQRFNLSMIMANRVVPDPDFLEWFTDRGMPLPPGVRAGVGLEGGDTTLAFADDPRWNRWAADHGRGTYARYLLTHPAYLLFEPWPDVLGLRGTTLEASGNPPVLVAPGDAYGRVHRVLPGAVESLVWGPGEAGAVAVGLAAVVALALRGGAWRRWRRLDPACAVGAIALVIAAGHLLLVWHASPLELGRLAMVPAVTVHVALVLLLAVTVDRRLTPEVA